jgi:hypothetical protein
MLLFFECMIFLLIIAYEVNIYSSKDIPFYCKLLVFLCWTLSFVILIVIPLDIYYVKFFKIELIQR